MRSPKCCRRRTWPADAGRRACRQAGQDRFVSSAADADAMPDVKIDQDGRGDGSDRRRCRDRASQVGRARSMRHALPAISDAARHALRLRPAALPWPRSGRWRRPRRRRSAWSRHAAPCSRAPARAARCRPICLPAALPFSFSILRTVSRSWRSSLRGRADHMARHDRGGGLAQRAGLHVMGKVGDHRTVHLEVDLDRRTAQLGMGGGAGVRCRRGGRVGEYCRPVR